MIVMKKVFLLCLLASCLVVPSMAQLNGDGYYRVQNFKSGRYIIMIDNKSKGASATSTTYDLDAMMTVKPFSRVAADAGSVVYVENCGGNQYNLRAQGTDVYATTGRYLTVTSKPSNTYWFSATVSGVTVYLYDEQWMGEEGRLLTANNSGNSGDVYRYWYFLPVSADNDDNYFGINGDIQVGNQYYTAFYDAFPYTFASAGMKAYTVTKIDKELVVWSPVEGTVPSNTPVIVACAGKDHSANRLNLEKQDAAPLSGNLLRGVYFNNIDVDYIDEEAYHFNATKYDPATMRLLGVTSEGKLGFVKSTEKYIPKNSSYLVVPEGSPDEMTLVTQEEYDAIVAADVVTVTARSYSRPYGDANPVFEYDVEGTLKGTPTVSCTATQSSPVGTYPIVVAQGTVTNHTFHATNGALTIEQAPLTITARSYTIKQNEELPQFVADYTGFKLDETSAVLSTQAQITCDVPADKTPGTYPIVVSGAEAQNYSITHVDGVLTILEADPITITATNLTKEYGDVMPKFSWTITGGTVKGQPELHCEATMASAPGTYPITVSKGTIDYPNLVFVDGTLTIAKAPLVISAGTYTMKQTDPRPEFVATYQGFKLDETEAVLTAQPVFTTDAPDDNTPGEYVVEVSGAESDNYDITYKAGRLIITDADQIVIVASDATMTYGDEVPQLTYKVSGGEVEGEAVVTCEATSTSPVGTYPVVVERGSISYPNLKLVNGTLTVTKAPLKVSVVDYEREEGEPNPDFEILYEGFRNGDDASVLIAVPVATTVATAESDPGVYGIIVEGGEAQNYAFTYEGGKLTVKAKPYDGISTVTFAVPVDVYTLTGKLVRSRATSISGLPKGIYVVNGRKLVVR